MESNIRTLGSYTTLKEILRVSYLHTKIPVIVHGAPGIGKSQVLKQVADELNIGFLPLMLSQFPSEDVTGLPVPRKQEDGGFVTIRSLPDFLPTSGKGILFFDEINQAQPSVLNAIFQLILDRKLAGNSYTLPEGWVVFAACNDVEHNQNITEFEPPWNDRFLHINFHPTSEEWLKYAKTKFNNRTYFFLSKNKECIFADDREMNEKVVFPTPRSWERVSELENHYDKEVLTDETLLWMISGLVGSPIGIKYMEQTLKQRRNKDTEIEEEDSDSTLPEAFEESNFNSYLEKFKKLPVYKQHSSVAECWDFIFKARLFDDNRISFSGKEENLMVRLISLCFISEYSPEYLMKKIAGYQRKTPNFNLKRFVENLNSATNNEFERVYPEIAKLGK